MQAAPAAPVYAEVLVDGEAALARSGVDTPRLDAEVLLAHAARSTRSELYLRLRAPVPIEVATRFEALLQRRCGREPIAYITGEQEFWSLAFAVGPDVLVPRPETETVVEAVLACVGGANAGAAPRICDVGTGSGCLAVVLARELPAARLWATDSSVAALAVAHGNALRHGVADRISFHAGDLFADVSPSTPFDLVVSNPPYVAAGDVLPPEVCREPCEALRAGEDGLDVIRRLLVAAPARLCAGGWLVVEFGSGQDRRIIEAAVAGGWAEITLRSDLAGIPRVLIARYAGRPWTKS
jgi:release factor glutamine methyltransferase